MINLDLIQVIVQGGAVGLLLAFGYFAYRFLNRLLTVGVSIITNHLTHLEKALLKTERALTKLDKSIDKLVKRGK